MSKVIAIERVELDVKLEIRECPGCGVVFGVTKHLVDSIFRLGDYIHCPNGHGYGWAQPQGEREEDRLRSELAKAAKKLEYAETQALEHRESAERAHRSNSALRGVVTRTKQRIARGVCPCCNRTFTDLHRHMAGKHPDYETEAVDVP